MSTVYTKTDSYGLNLYGDNDPADLRDGYNGSMRTIDTTLEQHLNRIEGVESREKHDEAVVKALLGDNTVDNATTAKTKWDKAGTDAITANGKADSNTAILAALGADNTSNASAKQTKWDDAATKADALEPRVQALERKQRNIVLLGDSWTVVHNNALYNRLKADMPNAIWHNYGINGAVVQQLPEMVNNAKKDTALHADEVTDVIIVMGTNNVFWTSIGNYPDITKNSAYTAFKAVRDYFTNANIIYVPNNSKTLNNGRNNLYAEMVDGAHMAGVATHEESLILLCGHREWFNGDDQEGVQHLSDNGYQQFADRIVSVLQGGIMMQEGRTGLVQLLTYSSPSDQSSVDDNTIQIYTWNHSTQKLGPVGWMQNPEASFTYYSDQTVTVSLRGVVKFWDTSQSGNDLNYIGCPNWYEHIAPNTLPYVFLNGRSDLYYQPKSVTGFTNDYLLQFQPREGGSVCNKSFYFSLDAQIYAQADKSVRLLIPHAQTAIMGVSR